MFKPFQIVLSPGAEKNTKSYQLIRLVKFVKDLLMIPATIKNNSKITSIILVIKGHILFVKCLIF